MTTAQADAPQRVLIRPVMRERSINEIISAARRRPTGVKRALWPVLLTSALLWCSYPPLDLGPLAWIALTPLLALVRVPKLSSRNYFSIWLGSCLFTFPALQWMRLGDPSMYLAWFALAAYCAAYFPTFVGLTRVACGRWRTPLWVAAPIIWTGLEFVRAHLLTGFAWYFLAHSQHRWNAILQISDVVGAYGVSFVIAMANSALAMLIPVGWLCQLGLVAPELQEEILAGRAVRRQRVVAVAAAVATCGAVWAYGCVRISQSNFTAGPRVALIQGNFPTSLKHDPNAWQEVTSKHQALTRLTMPQQPDVIVWPETMYRIPLFQAPADFSDEQLATLLPETPAARWRDAIVPGELRKMAEESNAALVLGIDALIARPGGYDHFNSAVFVTPDKGLTDRYDKLHRVPFGEYIPLRDVLPGLQSLTPFGDDFGIAAGAAVHVFPYQSWRMLPLICFEDTVPHLVRSMSRVGGDQAPVDVLVNLTNDGWFHGSSELDQHLITASFRCIENRMPMVRAVNTGISAFIDGNGQIREPDAIVDLDAMLDHERPPRTSIRDPRTGRFYTQWNAAFVANVPLDPRRSLYGMTGDWFASSCASLCVLMAIAGIVSRRSAPRVAVAD